MQLSWLDRFRGIAWGLQCKCQCQCVHSGHPATWHLSAFLRAASTAATALSVRRRRRLRRELVGRRDATRACRPLEL
eukprot:4425299-Pleurochrysis_carterae.AAC.1